MPNQHYVKLFTCMILFSLGTGRKNKDMLASGGWGIIYLFKE